MTESLDLKKVYAAAMCEMLEDGQPVMLVDIDVARLTGSDKVRAKFPDACVQVGIAEQNAVGVAAGLACMGNVVFAATFSNFISTRASDQALNTICYNQLDVKLVGTYAGISSGVNGGTHISVEDMAVYRCMPEMRVADPADGVEFASVLKTAAGTPGPAYIRMPKGPLPTLFGSERKFEWGKGVVMTEAEADVTVISSGLVTYDAGLAVERLKASGRPVRHIHMPSIKPLDEQLIIDAAKRSTVLVTVENHSILGGLGSAVGETTSTHAPARIVRLGIEDSFCEGVSEGELKKRCGISADCIFDRIAAL